MSDYRSKAEELVQVLRKYDNLLVYLKGSPDPDALGSAFALQVLGRKLGCGLRIETEKPLSLSQNRAFIKMIGIRSKVREIPSCQEQCKAFVVLDHPSAFVPALSGRIPCAVHIDHHQSSGEEELPADFRLIDENAGATASLLALLLRDCGIELDRDTLSRAATALIFAVQTDTDKYEHAGDIDFQALDFLAPHADIGLIRRLSTLPYSQATMRLLRKSRQSPVFHRDWLISGLGLISEKERDSMPLVADLLLKSHRVDLVATFALVVSEDQKHMTIDVSLRSRNQGLELPGLIKQFGVSGGARKNKGAFQVPFDFFRYFPDRSGLWQLVETTVISAFKTERDRQAQGIMVGLWPRLRDFFSGRN